MPAPTMRTENGMIYQVTSAVNDHVRPEEKNNYDQARNVINQRATLLDAKSKLSSLLGQSDRKRILMGLKERIESKLKHENNAQKFSY